MQVLEKAYLLVMFLSLFIGQSYAQNEFASEASEKQVTYKFSVTAKPGTAYFEIHGAVGTEKQIKRVQEVLEKNSAAIFNYFKYVPVNTVHMRINNASTRANGSAQAVPRNLVVLNTFPPVGSSHLVGHDDWYKGLVLHELVHIVHLEQANGFLYALTVLMGNVGRLGGLVPRWFTEGIATWAETKFTKGGRLRQEQLLAETKAFFERDNFCTTIDCLDNPGEYPFAGMSYWVGAAFMDYVERKNPGAISCIVHTNSYRVPFFFRGAWSQCINGDVDKIFAEFREGFISKKKKSHYYAKQEVIDPYETGEIVWQQDFQVIGPRIFWTQRYKDSSRLVTYNVKTKKRDVTYLDYYVDQVQKNKKGLYLATTRYRRSWVQKDLWQMGDIVGSGDFLTIRNGKKFIWRFSNRVWNLHDEQDNIVETLPELADIMDAFDDQLIVRKKDQYFLKQNARWYNLPGSSRLMGVCNGDVVLKGEKSLMVFNRGSLYETRSDWARDIIKGRFDKGSFVYQLKSDPTKLYRSNKGCRELVARIKNKSGNQSLALRKKASLGDVKVKEFKHEEKSYPSFSHFKPNVWFFSFESGTNYTKASVNTTVNDPLNRHTLSLTYDYYDKFEDILSGSYTYNWSGTKFSVFREADYTTTYGSDNKEVTEGFSIGRNFFFERFTYGLTLLADKYIEDDVVSRRKGKSESILQTLSVAPLFLDSFMRSTKLTSLTRFHEVDATSFREQDFKFQTKLQPATRFFAIFQGSYGKMDKDTINNGALFSGNYESSSFHEFIGLGTKSSFGNEVVTGRFMLDWEMTRIHRGWGFAPVMLRTLNFLGGTDYLKTDFIYLRSRTYLYKSYAQSYYAGLRSKWTVGYFLPIRADILRVRVKRDRWDIDEDTTEFFLGTDLTF